MKKRFSLHAFTLSELIIVSMVVAAMTALAVPRYMMAVETSKANEAETILSQVLLAQRTFYLENNKTAKYVSQLDINYSPNKIANYRYLKVCYPYFLYSIDTAAHFPVARIERKTEKKGNTTPRGYRIYIHRDGKFSCSPLGKISPCPPKYEQLEDGIYADAESSNEDPPE